MFRSGVYIIICVAAAMAAGLCVPGSAAAGVRGNTGAVDCPGRGNVVVFDYDMGRSPDECVNSRGDRDVPATDFSLKKRPSASDPMMKKDRKPVSPPIEKRKNSVVSAAKKSRVRSSGTLTHYRVRRGETLFSISRRFGVSLPELCAANGIHDKNSIRYGQVLMIPKGTAATVSPAGKSTPSGKIKKSPGRRPSFAWPVDSVVKYRRDGSRGVHSIGIVITARPGTRVTSSAGGVVRKIGEMRGYGRYVIVMHGERYVTVYSNLGSIRVNEGDRIRSGSMIGALRADSSTLHFQIDRSGKPQNPLSLLPARS